MTQCHWTLRRSLAKILNKLRLHYVIFRCAAHKGGMAIFWPVRGWGNLPRAEGHGPSARVVAKHYPSGQSRLISQRSHRVCSFLFLPSLMSSGGRSKFGGISVMRVCRLGALSRFLTPRLDRAEKKPSAGKDIEWVEVRSRTFRVRLLTRTGFARNCMHFSRGVPCL